MEPSPLPETAAALAGSAATPGDVGPRRRADGWQARLGVGAIVVCAAAALFWPHSDEPRVAPAGMLVDLHGRPIPLATRTAPVTLVHFWATWCPPCIGEIPTILRLAEEHHGDPDFALVMIAVQDDPEKVRTYLGDSVESSLFDNDWKVAKSYGTSKLPETHLVVDGKVVESFIGAQDWSDPRVRKKVAAGMAARVATTVAAQ